MKKRLFAITGTMVLSLMALMLFSSCNQPAQKSEEVNVEVTGRDSVTNFTVYTYEEKPVALREANKRLDEMNRQIEEWKADADAKAGEMSADAKAASDEAIADLERKRDEFKAEVEKMENSTQDNWDDVKRDIGNKYDEVTDDLQRGWKNLKENVKETVEDAEEAIK